MHPVLQSVRREPLRYLPEKSLSLLLAFLRGYAFRCEHEGCRPPWEDPGRLFHRWLNRHYFGGSPAIHSFRLIYSFSTSEADALDRFFNLLDLFEQQQQIPPAIPSPTSVLLEDPSFRGLLKNLRYNASMRQVQPRFLETCAYLNGESHAFLDLALPAESERALFESFKTWVEQTKIERLLDHGSRSSSTGAASTRTQCMTGSSPGLMNPPPR